MTGNSPLYKWYVVKCEQNVVPVPNEPHIKCWFNSRPISEAYYFENEKRATDACSIFDSALVSIEFNGTQIHCSAFQAEQTDDGHFVLFCEFPFPCPTIRLSA